MLEINKVIKIHDLGIMDICTKFKTKKSNCFLPGATLLAENETTTNHTD